MFSFRRLSRTALLAAILSAAPLSASAEPPAQLPIQGYLTADDGRPIEGEVTATFTLYNAATGGDVLYSEEVVLTPDGGAFTVYLGSGEPLDLALFRDTTDVFLGVAVGDDAEMTPRTRMATAPFAAYARYAADAATLEGRSASDFVEAGRIDWADIHNAPADLTDGDTDTQLTEAEVDAFVADNGYAETAALAAIAISGSWTDLVGVPADLLDGDADTLAGLGCASGQLVKWDGAAWGCADDLFGEGTSDTTLTEAEVDAFVANNGYAAAAALAAVATTGAWADLVGVPADLLDGDDDTDTTLTEAEVDAFVADNGYAAAADLANLAAIATSGSWTDLVGIPASIADGDQNTQLSEAQVDAYVANNGYASAADLAALADIAITGDWTDLANVPADLLDGDDDTDTLAGLGCATGQLPKWDGAAWSCAEDLFGEGTSDTTLTEAEVDAYVSNNGYLTSTSLAAIATTGHWTDLVGIPADIANGDQNTQLSEAQVDAFVADNGYAAAADLANLAAIATSGHWSDLQGIPASIADGDQNTQLSEAQVDAYVSNNGYATATALADIAITGDWSDLANVPADLLDGDANTDTLAGLGCASGQLAKWNGSSWACAADVDTDTDTKLTEAQVDAYVSDNGYLTSTSLAAIATTGHWTDLVGIPADIANGDQNTQLSEAQVDAFVADNGYVAAANLAAIATSGHWSDLGGVPTSLLDGDQNTTYSAGTGMSLSGTTFSVNLGTLDARYVNEGQTGVVSSSMIANGAVTNDKIASVDWSKVTNKPAAMPGSIASITPFSGEVQMATQAGGVRFAVTPALVTISGSQTVTIDGAGSIEMMGELAGGPCYRLSGSTAAPTYVERFNFNGSGAVPFSVSGATTLASGTYQVGACLDGDAASPYQGARMSGKVMVVNN